MDKSWMGKHRKSKEFNVGLNMFLDFAAKNSEKPNMILCPCTMCVNSCLITIMEVENHLLAYGMDQRYTTWVRHGEKYTSNTSRLADTNPNHVEGFVHQFEQGAPVDAPEMVELVQAVQDDIPDDPEIFMKRIEDAETPLYPGCLKFTKLSTVVRLFNLKAKNGWSDNSFTELLLLLKDMLPDGNHLPVSMYGAKKVLSSFGMEYQKIHACPNDCILFRKQYADDTVCPTCQTSRWKMNERTKKAIEGVAAKVLWYFPPIPRFKRMFQSVERAEQLIWHAQRRVYDGYLRHPSDSPIWKLVDYKWPDFGNEPRNLRLALSADGINPHGNMSSRYSCWPVLMIIYNLSPWLCMKRKHMMLTMLISGPHQPGNDIDVYFRPLLEDLNTLWENGVQAYDAFHRETFTLKAALLWTINDFPAYGSLCGCRVKGYKACPICGKNTSSFRLKFSKKICYMGHRKFLPSGHPFRNQKKAFNGDKEHGKAPIPLSGIEVFKEVETIENKWGKKQKKGRQIGVKSKRVNADSEYWKKKSDFFTYLPYWKYIDVRNCLDVMHIAKNVSESLIGTLLNIPGKSKDGLNARMDLVELGLRTELAPEVDKDKKKRTYLPPACFTLAKEERRIFCGFFFNLKTPQRFSSNLRNRVSMEDLKLYGLKSHDHYVLMQQFLPIAIRSILPKHVRFAITRLCFFFRAICSKEIDINSLPDIQKELIVTQCLLEKCFPPSFFDIMIHLPVHLVREVQLCGPIVPFRSMFSSERFMKVLKGYVRNRNRPEGCIAECYIAEEAIEFCSEFLSGMETIGVPRNRDDDTDMTVGKPKSGGYVDVFNYTSWPRAHRTVLANTKEVLPYIEKHMSFLKRKHPNKKNQAKWLQDEHNRTFIGWLKKQVEDELNEPDNNISNELKWISHGPNHTVVKYHGYAINGYTYHTKNRDMTLTTQNSGVQVVAGESCYYGVIEEIWLLDYTVLKIPVLKCKWVDIAGGIKQDDQLGLPLVELGKVGHKTDPFILASHAKQVFYVEDPLDPKWSFAIPSPQREYCDDDDDDETDIDHGIPPFNNVMPNDDCFDANDETESVYVRVGGEGVYVDEVIVANEEQGEASGPAPRVNDS